MSSQLIFKFPYKVKFLQQDFFVSQSNKECFDLIQCWPKWIKKTLNIFGPSGSGKSHLVSIFETKTSCEKIDCKNLSEEIFLRFKVKETLIIENTNDNINENILYSLFNITEQDNKYLLLTSNKPLKSYKFQLPDLKSRINSCPSVEIKLPNDELLKVILSKRFSDKQILIDKKHIDFIIKRIDRSYEKISQFVSMLDNYSLEKGKPFTLKIIKNVLEKL